MRRRSPPFAIKTHERRREIFRDKVGRFISENEYLRRQHISEGLKKYYEEQRKIAPPDSAAISFEDLADIDFRYSADETKGKKLKETIKKSRKSIKKFDRYLRRRIKEVKTEKGYSFQLEIKQGKKREYKDIHLYNQKDKKVYVVGRKKPVVLSGKYTDKQVYFIAINSAVKMKNFYNFRKDVARIRIKKIKPKK